MCAEAINGMNLPISPRPSSSTDGQRVSMNERVDYYVSAVRTRGEHVTHLRVHKALPGNSFAPHGIVQPRSTVIVNIRSNSRNYRTLAMSHSRVGPGDPVKIVEVDKRFYLRTDDGGDPKDSLGELPTF